MTKYKKCTNNENKRNTQNPDVKQQQYGNNKYCSLIVKNKSPQNRPASLAGRARQNKKVVYLVV